MTRRIVSLLFLASGLPAATALAQAPVQGPEPFRITDNSFLVEEAFNQEAGVFQNIFGAARTGNAWAATFTQEWPITSQTHQFSYTIAWMEAEGHNGAGDTLLNYRYQALIEGPGRPAFAPRASLVLPTGNTTHGFGAGSFGLQVNLPFSKQTGDVYWHWNAGLTLLARAKATNADGTVRHEDLASPFLAGSAIYRALPMVHLMLESVVLFQESIADSGTDRSTLFILSPGLRAGWDMGDRQAVMGVAVPVTWSDGHDTGVFLYFSYELPFKK